jgi:hypothetical protein
MILSSANAETVLNPGISLKALGLAVDVVLMIAG